MSTFGKFMEIMELICPPGSRQDWTEEEMIGYIRNLESVILGMLAGGSLVTEEIERILKELHHD